MQCEDKVETEHSLAKVHKVCRLIGIIVKIIFVVKRLRLIAGLLAIYAIVDVVISGHIGLVQYAGLNSGYVSTGGNEIIPINLAPIIGASVAFAFSFVFQYGVLLQELSDDTI